MTAPTRETENELREQLATAHAQLAALHQQHNDLRQRWAKRSAKISARARRYYYGPNHEQHKARRLAYYHENKARLLTRKEECERCGRMISHISRSSHWKSKRCQREHARRLREANPEAPENASEERDGHGVASPETCVVIRKPAQPMSLDAL